MKRIAGLISCALSSAGLFSGSVASFLFILFIAAPVAGVRAQAPAQLSIQGYLEDGGNPVNTPQTMELSIHTAVTGGTQLFSESHASVPVTDGVYTVLLGSIGNLTAVDFNQNLWLQTKVGATTLSPRTRLLGSPSAMTLVVPASVSGEAPDGRAVTVTNTATTGSYGHGLTAFSAAHGTSAGLYGVSVSPDGTGVIGLATNTGNQKTYGVYGLSSSYAGVGVYGEATASSGGGLTWTTYGVHGVTNSIHNGAGVLGVSNGDGLTNGVVGTTGTPSGNGVLGINTAGGGFAAGVRGETSSPTGTAVFGRSFSSTGLNYGVLGQSASSLGVGVFGNAVSTSGDGTGVLGKSVSSSGIGLLGDASGIEGIAVYGKATSPTGITFGVYAESRAVLGTGLFAVNWSGSGETVGVQGQVSSPDGHSGLFFGGQGVVIQGGPGATPDLVLKGTSGADDNGNLYSDPDMPSSDLVFASNDAIALHLDENNDEADSRFTISNGANATVFAVYESGTVEVLGTTVHSSDRNRKEDFADVDVQAVLHGVAGLSMQTWRYREDPVTHIGPMAQDFSAAFGVGQDDVTIASVDADGVALAAIQGLYNLVERQQKEIRDLQTQMEIMIAQLGK